MNCDICNVHIPEGVDAKEQHEMGKRHIKLRAQKESAQALAETSVFAKWKGKFHITEQNIKECFMQFGSIDRILLRSERSFAIIEYSEKSSADKALLAGNIRINEVNVTIEKRKIEFGETKAIKNNFDVDHVIKDLRQKRGFMIEADEIITNMVLSKEQVNQRLTFISNLEIALEEYLYKPKVVLFGSTITGIGTIDSDMDATVFVQDPPDAIPGLLRDKYTLLTCDASTFKGRKVTRGELIRLTSADRVRLVSKIINEIRKTAGWIGHQNPVLDARCPVVRFLIKSRFLIDLSVENSLGVQKSYYLKELIEKDESRNLMRILIILRFWALCQGLFEAPNNQHTGQFNAYILNLYAIYYLMLHKQIPHNISLPLEMTHGYCPMYNIEKYSLEGIDLAHFFKKFFIDTIEQSFPEVVMGPFKQVALKKQDFVDGIQSNSNAYACAKLSTLNILDPIEPSHNVSQNVSEKMCSLMKRKMMLALSSIKKSQSPHIINFIEVEKEVNATDEEKVELNAHHLCHLPDCSPKNIWRYKKLFFTIFEEIFLWSSISSDEPELKRMKLEDPMSYDEEISLSFGKYTINSRLWIGRRNIKRKILHNNPPAEFGPFDVEKMVTQELINTGNYSKDQQIAVVHPQLFRKATGHTMLTINLVEGSPNDVTDAFNFIRMLISNSWEYISEFVNGN